MKVVVTGGAGFIGSAVCRHLINDTDWSVVNLDKLTYAANLTSLESVASSPRYRFVHGDIADRGLVHAVFENKGRTPYCIWPLNPMSTVQSIRRRSKVAA
jgi:dTDP-glucose 4,6-dehydratase